MSFIITVPILQYKQTFTSYESKEGAVNQPSGRAVTQPSHLPWSSGDDFACHTDKRETGVRFSRERFLCTFFFSARNNTISLLRVIL